MIDASELVLVDTSIILKWFHSTGEAGVEEARAILDAHVDERLTAVILDLSVYELGNVLIRSLRWAAGETADQLDDLISICGTPLVPDAAWHRRAAELASAHGLTFYDASFVAAAEAVDARLVSADRQLINSDLADSAPSLVHELRLM